MEQEGETAPIGLIVDRVSEVPNIHVGDIHLCDIEDAADFGEGVNTPFVPGIAKSKRAVKILLKIEDVLTPQELRGIEALVN